MSVIYLQVISEVFLVETGEDRLFAICNPHLLSGLQVVLECNSAAVSMSPNALARLSIIRSHTKR